MAFAHRDWLPAVLSAVAVAILITALAVRPQPLPPGSANFDAAVQVAPSLTPVPGKTYAIDHLIAGDLIGTPVSPFAVPANSAVHVTGWVLDPRTLTPVDHLLVRIDNRAQNTIYNVHIERPDVAQVLGVPGAAASGFDAAISTKGLRAGDHRLSFAAVANDRRIFELPTAATITIAKS